MTRELVTSRRAPSPGSSQYQLSLQAPDFSQFPVSDLFRSLGPVEVFSAHHHWSAPRTVDIRRRPGEGLGFSVKMEAPVVVVGVEPAGLAEVRHSLTLSWQQLGTADTAPDTLLLWDV